MEKIKTERSIQAIYYILIGKKSIQTVQDAHIFKIGSFYGIYKTLGRDAFDERILQLKKQNVIKPHVENTIQLTEKGLNIVHQQKDDSFFQHINGLRYSDMEVAFSERLLLVIQTVTNSKMGYYSFIPIIDRSTITTWVRQFFYVHKDNQDKVLLALYHELRQLLKGISDLHASIFVDRLTGYQNYGQSIQQLCYQYNLHEHDIQLRLTATHHYMLHEVLNLQSQYPLLTNFVNDLTTNRFITNSAKKTNQLLHQHYSLKQIAAYRGLKLNTIYDHIVEIAIYDPSFPLHQYVDQSAYQEIIAAIKQANSFKLKQIKQLLRETTSYFQIRLVIATTTISLKSGENNESNSLFN